MKTIYYLYDTRENIPRYIGMTGMRIKRRLSSHKCSKGNTKREKWIKSVGEYLSIKEIEIVEDFIALEREEYWTDIHKDTVVNLRIGNKANDELREIFSKAQKLKPINWDALKKTHDKTRGVKKPKAWGENLKAKLTGVPKNKSLVEKMKKHHTEKYGIKVYIDGIKYDSLREASRATNISRVAIKMYLNDKVKKKKYNI